MTDTRLAPYPCATTWDQERELLQLVDELIAKEHKLTELLAFIETAWIAAGGEAQTEDTSGIL